MSEDIRKQINDAVKAHGAWKMHLRRSISTGTLDKPVNDIKADNLCQFGQWLREISLNDTKMALDENFRNIKRLHTKFHRAAGEVAAEIERGKTDIAKDMIESGSFNQCSEDLKQALMEWRRAL